MQEIRNAIAVVDHAPPMSSIEHGEASSSRAGNTYPRQSRTLERSQSMPAPRATASIDNNRPQQLRRLASLPASQTQSGHLLVQDTATVLPVRHGEALYSGTVSWKNGRLVSSDKTIQSLLDYALPEVTLEQSRRLARINGTRVTLHAHPDTEAALEKFKKVFSVDKANFKPASRHEEVHASGVASRVEEKLQAEIDIPLLQKAVERGNGASGKFAFGPHGTMSMGDALSVRAEAFLAAHAPTVSSNDDFLEAEIASRLRQNQDLRVRLGAEVMLETATKKEPQLIPLAGSLGVSAGIGSAWELWASQKLKDALFGKHFSPARHILPAAVVDSVPPVVIETLDTMFVLTSINSARGAKTWLTMMLQAVRKQAPWKRSEIMDDLKDTGKKASKAGVISSIAALPNNILQYWHAGPKPVDITASALATEVAIAGAASGIPPEVKEAREKMSAALVQSIKDGVMPGPDGDETPKAYITTATKHALDIAPGDSVAVKTMGVAMIVGMIPFLAGDRALNVVPESMLRIFRSTVFNPIEAIALNLLVLGSRVRIPGLFHSDHQRHARVVQTILARAGRDAQAGRDISPEELHAMLAPHHEFLRHVGQAVVDGMNATFDAVPAMIRRYAPESVSDRLGLNERPFGERIPYEDVTAEPSQPQETV